MEIPESDVDFFNYAGKKDFSCHLIWDAKWKHMVLRYGNCFGKNTIIHNLEGLNQPVGPHCDHKKRLKNDDQLLAKTLSILGDAVRSICESDENSSLVAPSTCFDGKNRVQRGY